MRKTLAAAILAFGLSLGAQASPVGIFIDFENGPFGSQPQGFIPNLMSGDPAPIVSFRSTNGNASDLSVTDFGGQSNGNALAVFQDTDGNTLAIDFTTQMGLLTLSFGNDDPDVTVPGDLAVLTLFLGGSQIAQVTVPLNRDDLMNQTIAYSGGPFDAATFAYTTAGLSPFTSGAFGTGLIEIVDDLTAFTFVAPVPEPGTLALFGAALLGLGAFRRRA